MEYQPTLQTVIFLSLFIVIYLFVLMRNTIRNAIDLYDFLLLSAVAIIPLFYILTPKWVVFLAKFIGVSFSFLILFGSLFVITFVYLYRLNIKLNQQNQKIILLVQEVGLLREALSREKGREHSKQEPRGN
ncbi:MAG: DUF2304 domain-containing protein [SAR324 cluster bacterium]|nr:DUF2304 domain-containing protein [SAR324 cluster bacterium]